MFEFSRIASDQDKWMDTLLLNGVSIGTIGLDDKGIFLKAKRNLTLQELNLLIAQLITRNPNLLSEKINIF